MRRLGYTRYVAQGGDQGASITDAMGRQAPEALLGIHMNLLVTALGGGAMPAETEQERAALEQIQTFRTRASATSLSRPRGLLTRDHILDNITLYWLTGTGASAARSYWESGRAQALAAAAGQARPEVKLPVGFTTFPDEIFRAPRSWVQKVYPTLAYFHEVDRGGHFAAWEEPELFAAEIRAAFESLR